MGGLRVEVRGFIGKARSVEVGGIAERAGQAAGLLAGVVAHGVASNEVAGSGVHVLGDESMPNAWLYQQLTTSGLRIHRFVGSL